MLTAVVQTAGEARYRELGLLCAELDRQGLHAETVQHRGESLYELFVRSLIASPSDQEYVIFLEDDAWIAPDFRERVEGYLRRGTFSVLMLYSNLKCTLEAERDPVKINASQLRSSVGLLVARDLRDSFADYVDTFRRDCPHHESAYDLALGRFCSREKLIVQAAAPSCVQHRIGPSLLGPRSSRRQSRSYRARYGEIPSC